MSSSLSLKYSLGLMCGLWAVAGVLSPQLQLRLGVAGGQFKKPPAQVIDFTPVGFDEETVPVQAGILHFRVPRVLMPDLNADQGQPSDCAMLLSESAGFNFIAARPSRSGLVPYRRALGLDKFEDEVSLLAAAYRANPQEASLWMSRTRARELGTLLDVRKMLPAGVRIVEVIRGDNIKGTLCLKEFDDHMTSMVFDYYSNDENLSGTVVLTMNRPSELTIKRARALLSSFRIAGTPTSSGF